MNVREKFAQEQQSLLNEWNADVAKLKLKAASAKEKTKAEIEKDVKELEHKLHDAGARLSELATAGEGAWDSAKKKVENSAQAVKSAVGAARAKFLQ